MSRADASGTDAIKEQDTTENFESAEIAGAGSVRYIEGGVPTERGVSAQRGISTADERGLADATRKRRIPEARPRQRIVPNSATYYQQYATMRRLRFCPFETSWAGFRTQAFRIPPAATGDRQVEAIARPSKYAQQTPEKFASIAVPRYNCGGCMETEDLSSN